MFLLLGFFRTCAIVQAFCRPLQAKSGHIFCQVHRLYGKSLDMIDDYQGQEAYRQPVPVWRGWSGIGKFVDVCGNASLYGLVFQWVPLGSIHPSKVRDLFAIQPKNQVPPVEPCRA